MTRADSDGLASGAAEEGSGGVALALSRSVECWIGVVEEPDRRVVKLAGRLGVAQVPELLEVCEAASSLEIDLTDLISADMAGIEALQLLRSRGAALVGAPGYLQLKLDSTPRPPATAWPPKRRSNRNG